MRRVIAFLMMGYGALTAVNAYADEPVVSAAANSRPVAANTFVPLQADRTSAQGKVSPALPAKAPRFIALTPTNFRMGIPLNHHVPIPQAEEVSAQALSTRTVSHEMMPREAIPQEVMSHAMMAQSHGDMSSEQAQQILSLFGSDQ